MGSRGEKKGGEGEGVSSPILPLAQQDPPPRCRLRQRTCGWWFGWMGKATWWEGGEIITEKVGATARQSVGMLRRVKGGHNRELGLLGGEAVDRTHSQSLILLHLK